MKIRKPTKEELKAKAKKYAPYAQAVISLAATGLAAYYMRKANAAEIELEILQTVDEDAWPSIEITPGAMKDFENGATLRVRMFEYEPGRKYVQMTTQEDGFPPEAEEAYKNRVGNQDENQNEK